MRTAKLIVPGDALTHSSSRSCALTRFIGQIGRNPASRVLIGSSNHAANDLRVRLRVDRGEPHELPSVAQSGLG